MRLNDDDLMELLEKIDKHLNDFIYYLIHYVFPAFMAAQFIDLVVSIFQHLYPQMF